MGMEPQEALSAVLNEYYPGPQRLGSDPTVDYINELLQQEGVDQGIPAVIDEASYKRAYNVINKIAPDKYRPMLNTYLQIARGILDQESGIKEVMKGNLQARQLEQNIKAKEMTDQIMQIDFTNPSNYVELKGSDHLDIPAY